MLFTDFDGDERLEKELREFNNRWFEKLNDLKVKEVEFSSRIKWKDYLDCKFPNPSIEKDVNTFIEIMKQSQFTNIEAEFSKCREVSYFFYLTNNILFYNQKYIFSIGF